MWSATEPRQRLSASRLYLVAGAAPGGRPLRDVLEPALKAGVDIFQLRDKTASDEALLEVAVEARRMTRQAGALLIVNDRPQVALAAGADGVHLGQQDMPVAQARGIVGSDRLIGLSTHSASQVQAAADVDYIGVGPVHATPTKPGRPAVGLALVAHAARVARVPFFAIGGLDAANLAPVLEAGATRVAVVRAITEAPDPQAAARGLREQLDAAGQPQEVRVGST
ncbi:MAG TPA: thiamine phosphate synthase [Solirubrobacteraceae bacterium]|nr:thiamine phosphate synthase [Solirubrobacteraceae bacterium]